MFKTNSSNIKPSVETQALGMMIVDARTVHTSLLYSILKARIAAQREIFDDYLNWNLERLEFLYADRFGCMPPESLAKTYRMITTKYDRGLIGVERC
jgi:hypothetical protein